MMELSSQSAMTFIRIRTVASVLLLLAIGANGHAQSAHVTIPFLANATKPNDLDFQGGECDIDRAGTTMTCRFQQVFLTTAAAAPDTCFVTTNRYDRVFRKQSDAQWISTEGLDGVCAVNDVVTLKDEGGVRWTMNRRKVATRKDAAPDCRAVDETPEVLSWQNVRRPLPCRFVQPGGLMP
jgi:hypothetical protein